MVSRKTLVIGVTVNLEHYENLRLEVSGETESASDADDLAAYLDEVLGRMGRTDPATAERIDSYRRRVLARDVNRGHPAAATGCHDGVCPLPTDILSRVVETAHPPLKPSRQHTPAKTSVPVHSPGAGGGRGAAVPSMSVAGTVHTPQVIPGPVPGRDIDGSSTGTTILPHDQDKAAHGSRVITSPAAATGADLPLHDEATPALTGAVTSGVAPVGVTPDVNANIPEHVAGIPAGVEAGNDVPSTPDSGLCELCHAPITEAERKTSQLFTSKNLCRTCMKRT